MMHSNLSREFIHATIDSIHQELRPVMPLHIARWEQNDGIQSLEEWEKNILIVKNFAENRPEHFLEHLKNQFDLGDLVQVEFTNAPNKDIFINGQKLSDLMKYSNKNDSWSCYYFQKIPLEIEIGDAEEFKGIIINDEFQIEDSFFRLTIKQKVNKVEFTFSDKNDV